MNWANAAAMSGIVIAAVLWNAGVVYLSKRCGPRAATSILIASLVIGAGLIGGLL